MGQALFRSHGNVQRRQAMVRDRGNVKELAIGDALDGGERLPNTSGVQAREAFGVGRQAGESPSRRVNDDPRHDRMPAQVVQRRDLDRVLLGDAGFRIHRRAAVIERVRRAEARSGRAAHGRGVHGVLPKLGPEQNRLARVHQRVHLLGKLESRDANHVAWGAIDHYRDPRDDMVPTPRRLPHQVHGLGGGQEGIALPLEQHDLHPCMAARQAVQKLLQHLVMALERREEEGTLPRVILQPEEVGAPKLVLRDERKHLADRLLGVVHDCLEEGRVPLVCPSEEVSAVLEHPHGPRLVVWRGVMQMMQMASPIPVSRAMHRLHRSVVEADPFHLLHGAGKQRYGPETPPRRGHRPPQNIKHNVRAKGDLYQNLRQPGAVFLLPRRLPRRFGAAVDELRTAQQQHLELGELGHLEAEIPEASRRRRQVGQAQNAQGVQVVRRPGRPEAEVSEMPLSERPCWHHHATLRRAPPQAYGDSLQLRQLRFLQPAEGLGGQVTRVEGQRPRVWQLLRHESQQSPPLFAAFGRMLEAEVPPGALAPRVQAAAAQPQRQRVGDAGQVGKDFERAQLQGEVVHTLGRRVTRGR
eukprot:scaffold1340_cov253-Pinguiococcus_pyrenoidosus.AAC.25